MTNTNIPSIQELFIDELLIKFRNKTNLVDYMKNELEIGNSAAYNRINGKIDLTMLEAQKLAQAHCISLDQFILPHYTRITFVSDAMRKLPANYGQYLSNVYKTLTQLNSKQNLATTTIGNEIPLFHYANFPNLYHFKLYYWKQTFWEGENQDQYFSIDSREVDQNIHQMTQKIGSEYYKMPSTEIWTTDLFTPILQQITFFLTLNSFKDPFDSLRLIEDVKALCQLLQEFCQSGTKQLRTDQTESSSIEVHYNELLDGTDGLLFDTGNVTYSFIKYDGPNFIRTQQSEFGIYSKKWIAKVINKSYGISAKDQRHRRAFFKKVRKQIDEAEKKMKYIIEGMV